MQSHPVPSHRLEHREGADHVAVQERLGIGERVVDVRLGGEMHDRVGLGDQLAHQVGVGDVALDQADVVLDDGASDSRLPAYVSASSTVTAASGRSRSVHGRSWRR